MAFPTGWNRKVMRFANTGNVFYTGQSGAVEVLLTAENLPSEMFDADGSYPARSDGGDIRISKDAAGTTQLAREIVNFNIDNNPANGYAEIWVKIPDGLKSIFDSGTTTSTSAFKLIQTGQNFLSTVFAGNIVFNTTDNTYAHVVSVDSDTQLTLDADIMTSGEGFEIYSSFNEFYVWYNNPSATEPAFTDTYGRNNVWTGDNYKAVYHMNESSTGQTDSTGNGHTAAINGTPARAAAKFAGGYCQGFDGSSEWFNITNHADFNVNQDYAIQCWAYSTDYGGEWRGVVTKNRDQADVAEWVGMWRSNANPGLINYRAGNNNANGGTFTQNQWICLLHRWQYNNNPWTGYRNNGGSSDASGTTQANEPKQLTGSDPVIGRALGVSEYFQGYIDEVRFLAGYRGLWRHAIDYHTFNDPADFIRGTAPEGGSPAGTESRDHAIGAGVGRGVYRGT